MLYDTLQIPFSVLSIIRNMNFGWPLVLDHGNMINRTLAFSPFGVHNGCTGLHQGESLWYWWGSCFQHAVQIKSKSFITYYPLMLVAVYRTHLSEISILVREMEIMSFVKDVIFDDYLLNKIRKVCFNLTLELRSAKIPCLNDHVNVNKISEHKNLLYTKKLLFFDNKNKMDHGCISKMAYMSGVIKVDLLVAYLQVAICLPNDVTQSFYAVWSWVTCREEMCSPPHWRGKQQH